MMNVIVFHNPKNNTGKRLRQVIEATRLESRVEYHKTLAGLVTTLTRPENRWSVAVLQVADRTELDNLISMGEWLEDLRIILVLPDHRPDTISKGHLLYPRFVAFADGELAHVGSVLEKMALVKRSPA